MELKDYQQQTLDTFNRYLEALKQARRQADEFSTLNIEKQQKTINMLFEDSWRETVSETITDPY